ncbi:MAG: GNAT family N-acetyltransferase [Lachnospiraceae bacterium]|nr:GNAT family N-acetyltransferase [Lachnospiraceae bacterium]
MTGSRIRQAKAEDAARIAEIEIFNYRLNFYPIFQDDQYYFKELSVPETVKKYQDDREWTNRTFVYDDGVVKGFIRVNGKEAEKLFVEPVLQGNSIGAKLLQFAVDEKGVDFLWALEKNQRAISFYERHGFHATQEKKFEADTAEYLVRLER